MADPEYAVVDILCDPEKFDDLSAIPNLIVKSSPRYVDDPNVVLVYALADAAAQTAAEGLGCTVTVRQSAADYAAKLSRVFDAINEGDAGGVA